MESILVGVDGSTNSIEALRWSADLANRAGLHLIAARVFTPTEAELPPSRAAELESEQLEELEMMCEGVPLDTGPPRCLILDGDAPNALLDAAARENADVLVVGGRGRGGFTDLHVGSVAHHLIHQTTLPTVVVPRTGSAPVSHIVLGVDGSDGSLRAAEVAAGLAARLEITVTAVFAFEPIAEWVHWSHPDSWRTDAEDDVREWAAAVERAGAKLEVDIERDIQAVPAIERVLEAHPDSLAVVGARGTGGFTGLRLGRVPLQLVHHTRSPVLVVPAAD